MWKAKGTQKLHPNEVEGGLQDEEGHNREGDRFGNDYAFRKDGGCATDR